MPFRVQEEQVCLTRGDSVRLRMRRLLHASFEQFQTGDASRGRDVFVPDTSPRSAPAASRFFEGRIHYSDQDGPLRQGELGKEVRRGGEDTPLGRHGLDVRQLLDHTNALVNKYPGNVGFWVFLLGHHGDRMHDRKRNSSEL